MPELQKNQSVVIPTAVMQLKDKDSHHISGLTGVRLGSDMISESGFGSDGSSMFEADTNQTLHSQIGLQEPPSLKGTRTKLTKKDKSFAKTITEELDSEMENMKPNLCPVSELDEVQYEAQKEARAKKANEVQFLTDFLSNDIKYTLRDADFV